MAYVLAPLLSGGKDPRASSGQKPTPSLCLLPPNPGSSASEGLEGKPKVRLIVSQVNAMWITSEFMKMQIQSHKEGP